MDAGLLHFHLGRPHAKRYLFRDRWVTVAEAAVLAGLSRSSIRARIRGRVIEDTPRRQGRPTPTLYAFQGRHLTVKEIAAELGCSIDAVYDRRCGDRIMEDDEVRAMPREPIHNERRITHRGITRTANEWASLTGVPGRVIRRRLNELGWSIERALATPVAHPRRHVIARTVTAFRRARNAHAIARMAAAFAAAHVTPTRGVSETFPNASGTGGRSRVNDLH